MRERLLKGFVYLGLSSLGLLSCTADRERTELTGFRHVIIDEQYSLDPWGKAAGDIDGDGSLDIVVGAHGSEELVWYRNPSWARSTIATGEAFGTDHEVVDIDNDGHNDIVSTTEEQLLWYQNSSWKANVIDAVSLHDVEAADLDDDGDLDLVGRDQSAFNGTGATLFFYRQQAPNKWARFTISAPEGEGLKVADLNGDSRIDVVVNGTWYQNQGGWGKRSWSPHKFARGWDWPHVYIDVGDINIDGRTDVVLAPAEAKESRYRLSWFENPDDVHATWTEHVIDADIETVHHFVGVGDMNNDTRPDVVTAEMHQSVDPDEIKIYFSSEPSGEGWRERVLGTAGSHSMRLMDADGDGDLDLFGANWSGEHQPIELWINQTCSAGASVWRRHVVDADMPWDSIFVSVADIDGDDLKDIIAGGWWYRNSGEVGSWKRYAIGAKAHNLAAVYDFDRDGDQDVLATQGRGAEANADFVLARNDGNGRFDIIPLAQASGDFLQGIAVGRFALGEGLSVALSWHRDGEGVQMLGIPENPIAQASEWQRISSASQDEALSSGDIDRDGDIDLLLGTRWLRNEGDHWTEITLFETADKPDRNRLADMNGDGRLDAIIGYEAISKEGAVAWYEQGADASDYWREHVVVRVTGPMSLDIAEMDRDGDLDITVGEHDLDNPAAARLLVLENIDGMGREWRQQVVYIGDEHHDGAQAADINNDGDVDIVSIGWSHRRVLLYENLTSECTGMAQTNSTGEAAP
jgi:hypothetical protein